MMRTKEDFLNVLNENKGIIFKVVNTYVHDPEDQKDLVQEITIQLWKSFENYDPKFKVSTWMYRIALNVAISNLRKSSTQKKHISPFEDQFIEISSDEGSEDQEDLLLLRKFIDDLDELNKALIILYLDGNSHEEIGRILNISTSNVGTKISRIKNKLKEQFKNYEK